MKFRFIAEHRERWPTNAMCAVLGVSRQGFYGFLKAPVTKRQARDAIVDAAVKTVFHEHKARYGSPRIWHTLKQDHALEVGKRRIEASMARQGLFAAKTKRFVVTTQADETARHAPNTLNRDFTATRPNERWVTDITYLDTSEGWVYLAAILDLYSRKVVGWSLGESLDTSLALAAFDMALEQRQPDEGALLHHSDRGCQYTSDLYMHAIRARGIELSMSRKGNCHDNAVAESFFATLKKELIYPKTWGTRAEMQHAVFSYIEIYYNKKRLHSSLGYRTPAAVESNFHQLKLAA
jgi:putative transposase